MHIFYWVWSDHTFSLHFLIMSDVEHLFISLSAIWLSVYRWFVQSFGGVESCTSWHVGSSFLCHWSNLWPLPWRSGFSNHWIAREVPCSNLLTVYFVIFGFTAFLELFTYFVCKCFIRKMCCEYFFQSVTFFFHFDEI